MSIFGSKDHVSQRWDAFKKIDWLVENGASSFIIAACVMM